MIGNDVVDLQQARIESNWQRRGFVNKLFSLEEQEIIQSAQDAEIMIWRLWSMKEAAYKIYNRQTGIRAFMPLSLCCTIQDSNYGKVSCKGKVYFTWTTIAHNLIHSIALCDINDYSNIYEPEPFQVAKDDLGLPYTKSSSGLVSPASISHHGKYLKMVALQRTH